MEIKMVWLQYIANFQKSTIDGPQTQFDHSFWCFTRLRQPQDERIICSYGTWVVWPCMHIGWVLQASPSNHYWRRHEVGQWLGFGWFWGWGTSDTQLARQKLGKNTSQPWRPPSPYGRHASPPLQRRFIQQSANMLCNKSMLLKLKNFIVVTIY